MKFFSPTRIFWLVFVVYLQPGILESLFDENDIFYSPYKMFNHLAVDRNNGTIFIGAVDRLYRLSPDLKLLDNVTTISNYSSPNHYKILAINQRNNELIACRCDSANFICEIYNFNNSSKLVLVSQKRISELTKIEVCLSKITFVTNNKQDTLDERFMKLYFAVSYNGYSANKNYNRAIGTFNLNSIPDASEKNDTFYIEAFITKHRDKYNVIYEYGFESGKYKYFLTNQKSSITPKSPYITKLIRICHSGELLWKRYTEIPIQCKSSKNDETYNMIQTATIGKSGLELARSLNISLDDDVLFGIFQNVREIEPISDGSSNYYSALCIYAIKEIDEMFNENIRSCFDGKGSPAFEPIMPNQTCVKQDQIIDSNFCASQANMPLVGNILIYTFVTISLNTLATAIATKPSENHTVVFIGTMSGHLKILVLKKVWDAFEYTELLIDKQSPVNSDLLFSPQKDNLYVMTKLKLTKINLQSFSCFSYSTYNSCAQSDKKFCRWCGSQNTCTTFYNCPSQFEVVEKNYKHFQTGAPEALKLYIPSLHSISPNVNIECLFNISKGPLLKYYGQSTSNDYYNIHCPIPEVDKIPPLSKNSDHLNAELLIRPPRVWGYASTNIVFFNCNNYTSCDTCVTSRFDCQWHSKEQKCVYYRENIPKNGSHRKHNCEWCQSTNTCNSSDNCSSPLMLYSFSCPGSPSPSISSFRPLSGPREGGTTVTIRGESLFYKFDDEDINQRITVAGVACTPYRDMYVSMKSITCEIEKLNSWQGQAGPVIIYLNGKSIESSQIFEFVDVKITDISPKEGPSYGGTVLVTKGENLNTGKSIEFIVGNSSCSVFSRNFTDVQCVTNSSSSVEKVKIIVKLDKNILNSTNNDSFSYVKDPERDENGFNNVPKGIPAGGVTILIRDINVTSNQQLLLHIYNGDHIYNTSCEISIDFSKTWTCLSPVIPDINSSSIDAENPLQMNVSLSNPMNNEPYLPSKNESLKFLLYPNPEFHYFLNSSIEFDDKNYVIIKGKNINKACQKKDIVVRVGNYTCEVISISSNQLICSLPKYSSSKYSEDNEQEHDILADHDTISVSVGNVSVTVRKQFIPIPEEPKTFPSIYVVMISGIVITILIALVISLIGWHFVIRKNSSQALKKLQQQVNLMGTETIAMKLCIKRVIIKNKINLDKKSSKILKLPEVEIEITSLPKETPGKSEESEYILPPDDRWEFPKQDLILGSFLGEGEFGKVVQAEAKNILKENITTTVAVKMLKDVHSDDDMVDLVSEMEIMKLVGVHINVLRLLGCCTRDGILLIITEYAQHGNLREFLRKHLPSDDEVFATNKLSQGTLIMFAVQVAEGMEHLSSVKCIHRDLAARNILVSDNYILKIADFGLARDAKNKDYYRKRSDGRLPVKWMAPESLCHRIYSTKSDVWSYGILLWEIFTLGGAPYPSLMDVGKLYQDLRSGYRMEKPPDCSMKTYTLMQKCWSFKPNDRPTFSTIVKYLKDESSNPKPASNEPSDEESETENLL